MVKQRKGTLYEVVFFRFEQTGCSSRFFAKYKDAVALYKELKEENDVAHIQVNNVATGKTNLEYMSKEYYV